MSVEPTGCCPPFDPQHWSDKTIRWNGKRFVKDRVRSFLHIPLNFGQVMQRCATRIDAAKAADEEPIVLADENSLWGADVFVSVAGDVADAEMATISGEFLTKVFEGPFKDIRRWIHEMEHYVETENRTLKRLYFYYTTCPKCAKAYGKNYVVLLAQV